MEISPQNDFEVVNNYDEFIVDADNFHLTRTNQQIVFYRLRTVMSTLGSGTIYIGETRRFTVDYREYLAQGEKLATISSVAVQAPALSGGNPQSTIGTGSKAPVLGFDNTFLHFWVVTGTVTEQVQVQITVTTSLNETLTDTVVVNVATP